MGKEQDLLALYKVYKQKICELVILLLIDNISVYSSATHFETKAELLVTGVIMLILK